MTGAAGRFDGTSRKAQEPQRVSRERLIAAR